MSLDQTFWFFSHHTVFDTTFFPPRFVCILWVFSHLYIYIASFFKTLPKSTIPAENSIIKEAVEMRTFQVMFVNQIRPIVWIDHDFRRWWTLIIFIGKRCILFQILCHPLLGQVGTSRFTVVSRHPNVCLCLAVHPYPSVPDFVYTIFRTVFCQWLSNSQISWPWTRPWID